MERIQDRNDLIRDPHTTALLYRGGSKTKMKNEIIGLKKELNTLKDEIHSIKNLLERMLDGR